MKYIAILLGLVTSLAHGASLPAQAQMYGKSAPCTVATPADLAAARLSPVATTGMGPMACFLMWSRSQHTGMSVSVRPLAMPDRDSGQVEIGPGMCAKALSEPAKNVQRQKTRSCKEIPGYGNFAALMTTDSDQGRFATILIFTNTRYRVVLLSTGVPGGDAAAVQSLGKVLAAKYR